MSDNYEHRIKVLEQTLQVMQKEISQVLGELHQALQVTMRGGQVGMGVLSDRLDRLEGDREDSLPLAQASDTGKEL